VKVDTNIRQPAQLRSKSRAILVGLFVLVVVVAEWRNVLAITSGFFWVTAIAMAYAGFEIGGTASSTLLRSHSRKISPPIANILLIMSFAISAAIIWARSRWLLMFFDSLWPPKVFPYPDSLLIAFHDWVDLKFPESDGLKIHGEFYFVLFTLNILSWTLLSLFGFQVGLFCHKGTRSVFGRLRNRIVTFFDSGTAG